MSVRHAWKKPSAPGSRRLGYLGRNFRCPTTIGSCTSARTPAVSSSAQCVRSRTAKPLPCAPWLSRRTKCSARKRSTIPELIHANHGRGAGSPDTDCAPLADRSPVNVPPGELARQFCVQRTGARTRLNGMNKLAGRQPASPSSGGFAPLREGVPHQQNCSRTWPWGLEGSTMTRSSMPNAVVVGAVRIPERTLCMRPTLAATGPTIGGY